MISRPAFYKREDVTKIYLPRTVEAEAEGISLRGKVDNSAQDKQKTLVWLIDMQIDFILPEGSLPVTGAIADSERTIEWIYDNLGAITQINCSLDTHTPMQIFHPAWWVDTDGNQPAPFTEILAADIETGRWMAVRDIDWSLEYVQKLEQGGKKKMMVWPYHCLQGSMGSSLLPALSEAIMVHAAARHAQPQYMIKGTLPQTEYYSALEPEIEFPPAGDNGRLNTEFLESLRQYDAIYVAGQARSHCVLATLTSVINYFGAEPDQIAKLHLLNDCTSSIAGFEESTAKTLTKFETQGLKIINSSDAIISG